MMYSSWADMRRPLASLGAVAGLFLALGLMTSGCGGPAKSGKITAKTSAFTEVGNASWYGKKFHGRVTASGERYDMHELTAAHPKLPFGTRVRVTNLDNGQVVVVRINDRGPFVKERIIDLSYAAAKKIDMLQAGVAKIGLQVIG